VAKVTVELEFDEQDLGPQWMNQDNLGILLYTDNGTKRELLKITAYREEDIDEKAIQALGWAYADACVDLDEGRDPRQKLVPEMMERAIIDLGIVK